MSIEDRLAELRQRGNRMLEGVLPRFEPLDLRVEGRKSEAQQVVEERLKNIRESKEN